MPKLSPCLWLDTEAEEAAAFYTSVFPNSRVVSTTHYTEVGPREAGSVLTVEFELDGQSFTALNGGPEFRFNEAISFQVACETQEEIDHYWSALTADGGEEGQCGWLKDKYGVSWQVEPASISRLIGEDADEASRDRVMQALLGMRKLDLAELEAAARG